MIDIDEAEKLPANSCGELFSNIDEFLTSISGQSLVDSYKVQDFCLDLRLFVKKNFDECKDEHNV